MSTQAEDVSPLLVAGDQTLFVKTWQTYRKVMVNNLMFHREVYDVLRRVLDDHARRPFRFLDVACGDAAATAGALRGAEIAAYYGIDISGAALDIAGRKLAALDCPVRLIERDFADALADWNQPVDVVWVGQSLHHLTTAAKLDFMRDVRRILTPRGLFLIWEPTRLPDEDRSGWLVRFEQSRDQWSALDDDEWDVMLSHVLASDFPETKEQWMSLGCDAGFSAARQLYTVPSELACVYCYRD